MLNLTCTRCQRKQRYTAEEFVGRFFVCKHCEAVNLLESPSGDRLQNFKPNAVPPYRPLEGSFQIQEHSSKSSGE